MLSSVAMLTLSSVSTGTTPASAAGGFLTTVLAIEADAGQHSSLALDADSNPVIAYQGMPDQVLKVAVCSDRSCARTPTDTVVDGTHGVGGYASLELNSSGFPVIAYSAGFPSHLKLATCHDTTCTLPPTFVTLDADHGTGPYASLELDSNDAPVVSYFHDGAKAVKLARCIDAECTAPAITTVDAADQVGTYTSLALKGADIPVISYVNFDTSIPAVKVAVCTVETCATVAPIATVATPATLVDSTSLALNGELPVISYATSDGVRLVACADATCTAGTTDTLVESNDSSYTSLALSDDGFPVISYFKRPGTTLMVAICGDETCGTTAVPARALITVDTSVTGRWSSLALDASGNPVIASYSDGDALLHLGYIPTTTIDVYAGAAASVPPTPDRPPDARGATPTAAAAKLGWPTDMVFDADGNLYFTDRANHTVRKVAAGGGPVSTVAGTPGVRCPDPTATPACGDGGDATAGLLRSPWGIAVDDLVPPNIYIGDYGDHRVRKIAADTNVITTIAGTGVAGYDEDDVPATEAMLNFPSGLALGANGAVMVADRGNHRIRKIDGGTISTHLGTGIAGPSAAICSTQGSTTCTLDQPTDIEAWSSPTTPSEPIDTFFIADRGNDTVLAAVPDESDGIRAHRIGSGVAGFHGGDFTTAQFDQPLSLAYDAPNSLLYIADSHNQAVRRFSMISGRTVTLAGNGTGKLGTGGYVAPDNAGGDALRTALNFPIGIAFLPSGTGAPGSLYVSAVYENQIRRLALGPNPPPPPPPPG
jgi:sugar lactone lactonase YvrE